VRFALRPWEVRYAPLHAQRPTNGALARLLAFGLGQAYAIPLHSIDWAWIWTAEVDSMARRSYQAWKALFSSQSILRAGSQKALLGWPLLGDGSQGTWKLLVD
jgi:hypothetical protein